MPGACLPRAVTSHDRTAERDTPMSKKYTLSSVTIPVVMVVNCVMRLHHDHFADIFEQTRTIFTMKFYLRGEGQK